MGDYVVEGGSLVEVHGGDGTITTYEVLRQFDVAHKRTMRQDPAYGIRQLVNIGEKACHRRSTTRRPRGSPSTTSAIYSIASRTDPSSRRVPDDDGVVRLVRTVMTWAGTCSWRWRSGSTANIGQAAATAPARHDGQLLRVVPASGASHSSVRSDSSIGAPGAPFPTSKNDTSPRAQTNRASATSTTRARGVAGVARPQVRERSTRGPEGDVLGRRRGRDGGHGEPGSGSSGQVVPLSPRHPDWTTNHATARGTVGGLHEREVPPRCAPPGTGAVAGPGSMFGLAEGRHSDGFLPHDPFRRVPVADRRPEWSPLAR